MYIFLMNRYIVDSVHKIIDEQLAKTKLVNFTGMSSTSFRTKYVPNAFLACLFIKFVLLMDNECT